MTGVHVSWVEVLSTSTQVLPAGDNLLTLPRAVTSDATQHCRAAEHCYGNHLTAGFHVAAALVCRSCPLLRCQVNKRGKQGGKYAAVAKLVWVTNVSSRASFQKAAK